MNRSEFKLLRLQAALITCSIVSPIVTTKLIQTNLTVFNIEATFSASVFIYAVVFMISNVITERYGKENSVMTTRVGIFAQIISSLLLFIVQILPAHDKEIQEAYKLILGSNFIFVIAGVVAYFASQSCNTFIYVAIRTKRKLQPWTVNIISTIVGQLVDTVMFLGLAFGLGLQYFFNTEQRNILLVMMLIQYALRAIIVFAEIPIFIWITKNYGKHQVG